MLELEFKRPGLEDKEVIAHYFEAYPSRSCERTFVNVFLWARFYDTEYAVFHNTLIFRSPDEDGTMSYTFPAGEDEDIKAVIRLLEEDSKEKNQRFMLYGVTPDQFEKMERWFPDEYEIVYERNWADYVYEREKLVTLSGKKLHGKRNHINKFKAAHENWSYETLDEKNIEACFQMALTWRNENGCEDDEEKNDEMCVTLNSLRLFKELGLTGGLLRIDGEIIAFTLGERLCEDTFVVHIEKAFANVDGAYPMINQQFVMHECENFQYINREEDAGAEGLRKAKLSYRPAFLVEKGFVTRK